MSSRPGRRWPSSATPARRCGPHLHFGVLDRPDPVTGRSLPFVLDSYTLVGTVDFATSDGDNLVITPVGRQIRSEYPLYGGIQNFP